MSGHWCDDESDHRKQARDDFHWRGYYGYDRERYRDQWDDCNRIYTEEFDRLRRERDEEREAEERREERRSDELRRYEHYDQSPPAEGRE